MDDPPPIPKLLLYLFGDAAAAAFRGASPRLLRWCRAFDDWLDERRQNFSYHNYKLVQRTWRRFLSQQGKLPWELTPADIEAHLAWMRSQEGRPPATSIPPCARSANFSPGATSAGSTRNARPASTRSPVSRVPKNHPYGGQLLLSRDELDRLLAFMQRDGSPIGRRDYVFVLARLRLGVSLARLRKLRWEQIELDGSGAWVRWRPGSPPFRLPDEVWGAIRDWLSSSGRLPGLSPGDYIFTPLFGLFRQTPAGSPEAWDSARYLAYHTIQYTLRLYGRQVGIVDRKLTASVFYRTAIRLRLEAGAGLAEMRAFTASREQAPYFEYKLSCLPQLPPDPPPGGPEQDAYAEPAILRHEGVPFLPGHDLKHGLFAHSQPAGEVLAVLDEDLQGIQAELSGLRLLGRGLLALQAQPCTGKELAQLAQAYTLTAARLAMMIQSEKRLAPGDQDGGWADRFLAMLDSIEAARGEPPVSPAIRAEALGSNPGLEAGSRRLDEEVAAIRLVLRRALALVCEAEQHGQIGEYIHLVDIYSTGCNRLMRLLAADQTGRGRLEAYLREMIDIVLKEAQADWPQY